MRLERDLEVYGVFRMQANNLVIKLWGEKRFSTPGLKLKNHVDLVELLGIADTKRGSIDLHFGDLLIL